MMSPGLVFTIPVWARASTGRREQGLVTREGAFDRPISIRRSVPSRSGLERLWASVWRGLSELGSRMEPGWMRRKRSETGLRTLGTGLGFRLLGLASRTPRSLA